MDPILADLVGLLDLENIEINIFRGESRDIGSPQVYGGQVLGQALSAANRTVENRWAHSLHAYFLRRGDVNAPIVYQVEHARDGRSFTNRRITAIQHGKQIFNMTVSYQIDEEGLDHRVPMSEVPGPEECADIAEVSEEDIADFPKKVQLFMKHRRPFFVRPVRSGETGAMQPVKHVWMKAVDILPDDREVHQSLLAYISDYELLATATIPHGQSSNFRRFLQMASLDHAMWFHRQFRVDEWLLFSYDSPSASSSRGLARGQVFTRDGVLVASTAQEGLIRLRR